MLTELLKQPQYQPMSMTDQVLSLFAAKNGYMNDVDISDIRSFENTLHRIFHENHADVCNEIEEKGKLDDELIERIKTGMQEALERYTLVRGVK
jgi:F-type H+-transporting ATPase subunit alpha